MSEDQTAKDFKSHQMSAPPSMPRYRLFRSQFLAVARSFWALFFLMLLPALWGLKYDAHSQTPREVKIGATISF